MQFVFASEYRHVFGCPLGKSDLFLEQSRTNAIYHHHEAFKEDGLVTDIQNDWLYGVGFSCNICRIAMNWNDYLFSCQCDCEMSHEFCVSCVHSILIQYGEMKPFMTEILKDVLDNDSIELIVAYCVGKVLRFNHKRTSLKRKNECI